MQLYPTRTAAHLAIAGMVVVGVGVVARQPAIVAWGGAVVLAIAIARAVTLVSVSRIRAAGFEMLWSGSKRIGSVGRGGTLEIEAEVRNRDTLAARYVKLRAIASSQLQVTIEPRAGEVPASGRLKVKVRVTGPRVGRHGVHGLALEVHGASGLFEVPLTFANPYGVEVLPRPFAPYLMQARGGRSHLYAPSGRPGRSRGDGSDLRELREYQPGDPFRRIAWKASAKRGQVLVRDFEREERDIVWVILDVSVDLWAGPLGRAPLDLALDEAASLVTRYLGRGDRVGLLLTAAGHRVTIPPDLGPIQGQKIARALVTGGSTHDFDRSDIDEQDVALRVLEHLRPLDPRGLADVRRGDLDKLAGRAEAMRPRAPFAAQAPPRGRTAREIQLRRYLAAFGIDVPAKIDPDRGAAQTALLDALGHVGRTKPHASVVHVIAPAPSERAGVEVGVAARRVARSGATILWTVPSIEQALAPPWDDPSKRAEDDEPPLWPRRESPDFGETAAIVAEAVLVRARAAEARRELSLKRAGVRIVRLRPMVRPSLTDVGTPGPNEPGTV